MGLVIVLLIWLILGGSVAVLGAIVLATGTALLTRKVGTGRRRTIVAAGLLPFASLAWVAVVFVVQAVISETVLQQDVGLGDDWHCPLVGDYQLLMIDVPDRGCVYNPKTQGPSGIVSEQSDAVFDVVKLQVTDPYLVCGRAQGATTVPVAATLPVDAYFVLDTRTGAKSEFADYPSLQTYLAQIGVVPDLQPVDVVYAQHARGWVDLIIFGSAVLPPLAGGAWLSRRVWRLRAGSVSTPTPPPLPGQATG